MHKFKVGLSVFAALALAVLSTVPAGEKLADAVTATSAAASRVGAIHATTTPVALFTTFPSFLATTHRATYADYSARTRTGGVENALAFDQMQSYIEDLYRGVKTVSSFDYQGNTFDCVTQMSQPSVTSLGLTHLAPPPKLRAVVSATKGRADMFPAHSVTSPLELGLKDEFGRSVSCPAGTIPMERVTLEAVTRFHTMRDFLSKDAASTSPAGESRWRLSGPCVFFCSSHIHAYGRQNVANHGGTSWLNLWNPSGEFSLSQQWYASGSGTGLQTVEGGWVHSTYFGDNSVLFVFYTTDGYTQHGCYNLNCTPGFVQVDNTWALGAGFDHYSSDGGTQWEFGMTWMYYQNNWWLALAANGKVTVVGYYPGSLYGPNGPLANGNATLTQFGGEVVQNSGFGWPQMGSGNFASTGWQHALLPAASRLHHDQRLRRIELHYGKL